MSPGNAVPLTFARATPADVPAIVDVRTRAALLLAAQFGAGHWSSPPTERGVLGEILGRRGTTVYAARHDHVVVATWILGTRKPWAIDRAYFTPAARPLYLTAMAVDPAFQRRGWGRDCIVEARRAAIAWPADAIWLDAYDALAGAGGFYARCGFREVGNATYRGVPLRYFEMRIPALV